MASEIDNDLAVDLVARCAAGDKRALEMLYKLFERRIFRFALHHLGSEHDVEAVVVDTMYEVWRSAANFRGESLVSSWVLGIARFKAADLRRKDSRYDPELPPDPMDPVDPPDPTPAPQDMIAMRQELEQADRCIARLSPAHREVFRLYVLGFREAEIAQQQSVPGGTVKSRLSAARKHFDDCMSNSGSWSHRN